MVLRVGNFREKVDYEGGTLENGISDLLKKTIEIFLDSSTM
jgi:hypothetical protein